MTSSDIWDHETAAQYDETSAYLCAPEMLDPAGAFLASLAGEGAALVAYDPTRGGYVADARYYSAIRREDREPVREISADEFARQVNRLRLDEGTGGSKELPDPEGPTL